MARLVDDTTLPDLADLVDSVGELITPILDMDHGVIATDVATVDIGDAQQLRLRLSLFQAL
jgi:hypothetical protein